MKISKLRLKSIIKEELQDLKGGDPSNIYDQLQEAYHILEDANANFPQLQLQGALDSVANVLDSMDAGDSSGTGRYFE